MQAAILNGYGDEENIKFIKNKTKPSLEDYDVIIRVKACNINSLDINVRNGEYNGLIQLPIIPGYIISGIVESKRSNIKTIEVGDEIICISPLDNSSGGCAELCGQFASNIIKKPDLVTHDEAVAVLSSGLEAYTAFHYLLHLRSNDFLLIITPPYRADTIAVQIANTIGARVITTASSDEQLNMFTDCASDIVRVIDIQSENIVDCIMQETGGLGVNCILDLQYINMKENNDEEFKDYKNLKISKSDILKCLSVHGRWCTNQSTLQLDPPDSQRLFLRNASLSFLFPSAWLLAPVLHGRYLHLLHDLLKKLVDGNIKLHASSDMYTLDKIRKAYRELTSSSIGKIIIRP